MVLKLLYGCFLFLTLSFFVPLKLSGSDVLISTIDSEGNEITYHYIEEDKKLIFNMRALFNGVEVAGSQSSEQSNIGIAGRDTRTLTTSFLLSATSGQALNIQFTANTTSDSLLPTRPGTTPTSASLTISRIL